MVNPPEIYVGGRTGYVPPPRNIAPSAALYKTDKDRRQGALPRTTGATLPPRLKNAGTIKDDGSADDFSFIQNNTAKEDNGPWIVIAGGGMSG